MVNLIVGFPSEAEGSNSHFGRVNQITGTPQDDDPVKVAAKQDYKSFLQQQIEERAKLKAAQKEKERLEDEREVRFRELSESFPILVWFYFSEPF